MRLARAVTSQAHLFRHTLFSQQYRGLVAEPSPTLPKNLGDKSFPETEASSTVSLGSEHTTTSQPNIAALQPHRFGLRLGEAEAMGLTEPMLRKVDLANASSSEKWDVERRRIIEHFGRRRGDTGSVEVQVALLTGRIKQLAGHVREHHKDRNSKRGLLGLVNDRKKLLAYMKSQPEVEERYQKLQSTFVPSN